VARVLIIGGDARAAALASALIERGYAVRAVGVADLPPGVERFDADPERPGTLKSALEQVTIACWLFGSDERDQERVETLNAARLERFLHQTIDSSVRGLLYEAAGSAGEELLARGLATVREFAQQNAIPLAVLACDAREAQQWLAEALEAVTSLVERYPSPIS